MKSIIVYILLYIVNTGATSPQVLLYSLFSWGSLAGNITFSGNGVPNENISITITVDYAGIAVVPDPEEFDWAIHEFPLRYDKPKRCDRINIGKSIINLTTVLGKITVPSSQTFVTNQISLVGPKSIWGRSVLIKGSQTSCGSIHGVGEENTYESRFHSPVGGSIWIRSWEWSVGGSDGKNGTETVLISDIFNTFDDDRTSYKLDWNLYVTDIIADRNQEQASCNFLTFVYDLEGRKSCGDNGCPYGDLTHRFQQLIVPAAKSRSSMTIYHASDFKVPQMTGPRNLYIGIEDGVLNDHVYACAKIRLIKPKKVQCIFNTDGVRGNITMEQKSVFSPTDLTLNLEGLRAVAGGFHVHELPVLPPIRQGESVCSKTAGHYNPYRYDPKESPPPGTGSQDQYELGDISGKHGMLTGLDTIAATVTDYNLPLFGLQSIVGRSIVIHKEDSSRWVCSNLREEVDLIKYLVLFRYPFVGEILMEQDASNSLADTTVHVGPLLYSDGSHNDTSDHDWLIHLNTPGKDFYDWQNRCRSTGDEVFNPYQISNAHRVYRGCNPGNPLRCMVGDLSGRLGKINVAGSIESSQKSRKVFTDINLPLTGIRAIHKRSVVVFDKTAPKHRGNKTACTGIYRRFRYKAVVNNWASTDVSATMKGKIEFIQETPFDVTNTEVQLTGLQGLASGYHVHMVPVLPGLAFPCQGTTLYGHFNPLSIDPSMSPPAGTGTDDLYEQGDMSGKYGTLDRIHDIHEFYNDTNLQLFGPLSILGRSVVIHKKEENKRWLCGSIGWGYSPSEARQVAAIASFHNPKGYAWGYVRFRQLIYYDGSMSETYIEVNLRHPGTNNKNITRGHNWSIYVNPVGVDAAVKFFQSRCVASGYRWNPFLIQLAFPNDRDYYDKQCTPEFPLRCDAGDLSGRLGPVDLGDKRFVFLDKNLPLDGEHSAMGKAVIIHNERGRVERFACGNILPDHDIIKWVNVRRTARFSPTLFMGEMRDILGAPEWFLALDQQTVSYSEDNECVTFKIYFMGPYAHALEVDFSRLLVGGILEKPTVTIPGIYPDPKRKKKVLYKSCGGFEEEDLDNLGKEKPWFNFNLLDDSNIANMIDVTGSLLAANVLLLIAGFI